MKNPDPEVALTLTEAARLLGKDRETIAKMIRERRMPGINFGSEARPNYLIPRIQFDAFLAGTWRPAAPKPNPVDLVARTAPKRHVG
jgi:excisionase family DNA binding protein